MNTIEIELPEASVGRIQSFADEEEQVESPPTHDHPLWVDAYPFDIVLIRSHGDDGWMILKPYRTWSSYIRGLPDDLRALCMTLAETGRKGDLDIAGRIREQASKHSDTSDWPGQRAPRKKAPPRDREAVAAAWKAGKPLRSGAFSTDGKTLWSWSLVIGVTKRGRKIAFDYCGKVSWSTSTHCGAAIKVADSVRHP